MGIVRPPTVTLESPITENKKDNKDLKSPMGAEACFALSPATSTTSDPSPRA
jgi:hypothetical protein